MMMIERWPDHGAEIRVYTLTPEEIARQNRRDNWCRRRAIVRCALQRWRSVNAGCDETEQQTLER